MKVVPQLSARAFRLAEASQLGKPLKEFRAGWDWKWVFQSIGMGLVPLACLIVFLPLLSFSDYFPYFCFTSQCLAQANYDIFDIFIALFFSFWGVFGIILIVLPLCDVLWTLVVGEQHVFLCSKGLIAARSRTVLFDHWAATEVRRFYSVIVDKKTKERETDMSSGPFFLWRLSTSGQFLGLEEEAGTLVEQEQVAAVLPEALMRYDANERLCFGWLSVDREGIHLDETVELPMPMPKFLSFLKRIAPKSRPTLSGNCLSTGERSLSWDALEGFWIDSSHRALVLDDGGDQLWASVPLTEMINLEVCLWVLEYGRLLHSRGLGAH